MGDKLINKVAIITGCSGGIGKEIAIRFATEGAKLAICARNVEKLQQTAEICREKGAEVLAMKCDVTVPEEMEAFVKATVDRFGGLDILVNNAVSAKPGSPFMEQSEEYLQGLWESGFLSTWRMMKLCFPHLKEKGGKIVNFGSASGLMATEGYSGYGAVKEAIRSLTRSVAKEWGQYRINVNSICPSALTESTWEVIRAMPEGMQTPEALGFVIPPLGRVGDAYEDIAPVVVFLSSDDSQHMTGQNLRVDGGGTIYSG